MSPCLSLLPHQLPPFHLPNTSPALFSALLVLKSTVPRLPPSPRHSLLDVPTQSLKVPRRSHLECQGWAAGVPGVKEWVSQALEAKGEFSNDELNSHLPLFTRDTGLSSTSPTPAAPPTHTHTMLVLFFIFCFQKASSPRRVLHNAAWHHWASWPVHTLVHSASLQRKDLFHT